MHVSCFYFYFYFFYNSSLPSCTETCMAALCFPQHAHTHGDTPDSTLLTSNLHPALIKRMLFPSVVSARGLGHHGVKVKNNHIDTGTEKAPWGVASHPHTYTQHKKLMYEIHLKASYINRCACVWFIGESSGSFWFTDVWGEFRFRSVHTRAHLTWTCNTSPFV